VKGGDVSVKTLEPFHSGAITTDGKIKGKVTIDASPFVPIPDSGKETGSGSGQAGSGSTQTNTADGASGSSFNASGASSGDTSGITISHSEPIGSNSPPPDDTNVAYPSASLFISDSKSSFSNQDDFIKDILEETQSEDGLDSPEAVRRRILTFLEARQLAGEKWTAQAIAQKLDIPLEIAQIAVLNPIGQNIKVPIPDISGITDRGLLIAQATTRDNPIDCWWCAIPFAVDQLGKLVDWLFQSTHDHGGGKNSQHGKSEDRPSDLRRLKELQDQLQQAQGKEKKAIQVKINRLREEMAKRRKGENHNQKPKK
jgi:hypothetical protein